MLGHVENSYVEEVSQQELVYGAIDGMMGRLDPHSVFMRPELFKALRDETSGEFDGLGLELTIQDDQLVVISPMADSPGERAGLLPGDRLVSIDGTSTRDMTLAEAGRRLKGPAGSKVVLEVMRDGFTAPQRLTLLRDRIRLQSVEWRVLDAPRRYAYVRVKAFQDRTDRALRKALDDARAAAEGRAARAGARPAQRSRAACSTRRCAWPTPSSPAGSSSPPRGATGAPSRWRRRTRRTPSPTTRSSCWSTRGRPAPARSWPARCRTTGAAVIMGTQTFGKGSVQSIIELEGGAGLKLTVARYYTPRHRSIQELGITPDVVVADAAPPLRDDGRGREGPEAPPAQRRRRAARSRRRRGPARTTSCAPRSTT